MDPTVGTGEQRSVLWTAIRGVSSLSQLVCVVGWSTYRQRLPGRAVGSAGNTAERLMCPPNWNAPCLPRCALACRCCPVSPRLALPSGLIPADRLCPRRTTSGRMARLPSEMRTNPAITHMPPRATRDSRDAPIPPMNDDKGHSWSELLLGTRTRSVACTHTHAHAQGHASHSSRVRVSPTADSHCGICTYSTVQYMRESTCSRNNRRACSQATVLKQRVDKSTTQQRAVARR